MACRFALLLDRGNEGHRRPLAVHLTCPACGGHHAGAVTEGLQLDRPWRAAERVATVTTSAETEGGDPTHRCRDCGHQWAEVIPASPPPT